MSAAAATPLISVVVLNYNGARWIERCLASLKTQTIAAQIEVIVADNLSTDGSDKLAEQLVQGWPGARFIQNGENCGYCEGNNRAVKPASGRYLFILNNDAWLEPGCLETLLAEVQRANAAAATPLVMNYDDDSFQSLGAQGFDIFGLPSTRLEHTDTREVFMPEGCSYLIERALFERLGGFDAQFYMYADELDLSWRVWAAGHKAIAVPAARLHHRGAASVNPEQGSQRVAPAHGQLHRAGGASTGGEAPVVEFRTSDSKRFYSNRNTLLVLLKNAQNLLLLLVPLQLALFAAEAVAGLVLIRRWSFVKRAYLEAVGDCWRLRGHVLAERRRLRPFRQCNDAQMLRFLCWRLSRWYELQLLWRFGVKVSKS
jgi:GT2 family glycosyltransferase